MKNSMPDQELKFTKKKLLTILIILIVAIFTVDLMIPLGVAAGVPYAFVVLLSVRLNWSFYTWCFAIFCSFLTILGYILSEEAGITWMVLSNRFLAIAAIWITAILGIKLQYQMQLNKQHEGFFKGFLNASPIMLWRADDFGNWIYCSDGWLSFTGRTPALEYDKGWQTGIHPDDLSELRSLFNNMIENHVVFQTECRVLNRDNNYHWVLIQGGPIIENSGQTSGFIGSVLEIQDKKEIERNLESTRQKYYQREKMASIGILASGVMHEVGNPLASLTGLMNFIKSQVELGSSQPKSQKMLIEHIDMVNNELQRLIAITADVGDFATIPVGNQQLLNLNDYVDRTYRLMQHDERIWSMEFSRHLEKNIPAISMTADHLVQILQNLISNSIDACEWEGSSKKIEIRTYLSERNVCVEVKDTGVGMAPEVLEKAKQEFYSTKPSGKGMGLGLSLCQSLILENNGSMDIESKLGAGTTVVITFPLV